MIVPNAAHLMIEAPEEMGRREQARWWMRTSEGDLEAARLLTEAGQSRYPNGLGGDPTVYYDQELAREAIDLAERFLLFGREDPEGGGG